MALTFAQIKALVLANVARPDKAGEIGGFVNLALREAAQLHDWGELRGESDLEIGEGDVRAGLPTNLARLVEARLINGTSSFEMTILSKGVVVGMHPNIAEEGSGIPTHGYVEGRMLYFLPPANAEYTIRITMVRNPIELVGDGDLSEVPGLDAFLISHATAAVYRSMQLYEDAVVWVGEAQRQLLNTMRADVRRPGVNNLAAGYKRGEGGPAQPWLDPYSGLPRRRVQ